MTGSTIQIVIHFILLLFLMYLLFLLLRRLFREAIHYLLDHVRYGVVRYGGLVILTVCLMLVVFSTIL